MSGATVRLTGRTFEAWRDAARDLLAAEIPPDRARFVDPDGVQLELLGGAPVPAAAGSLTAPRRFVELARRATCADAPDRWSVPYAVLWRLRHGEPRLLDRAADPAVRRLGDLARQVDRDLHHLHAFVRFRQLGAGEDVAYVAFHVPDHDVLDLAAPFFVERFGGMRWSILTPRGSLLYDGAELRRGPPAAREDAPSDDALEALWRTYYAATFEPGRLNPRLLQAKLPERYRSTLPEAELVAALLRDAPARRERLARNTPGAIDEWLPADRDLPSLAAAVVGCRACEFADRATQAVFGEGPPTAALALVGEQPGDVEDRQGRPFVGPAGQLLDAAIAAAGLRREELYLTNAVKHFKWTRGRGRMHQTANPTEIATCRTWVDAEIAAVRPRVVVALGATAALSLLGRKVPVGRSRGQTWPSRHGPIVVTWHPSAVLRAPEPTSEVLFDGLVADLRAAAALAASG